MNATRTTQMLETPPVQTPAPSRASHTVERIHTDMMQAMRQGVYLAGGRLPNERQLAEYYGTSRQQIRNTLHLLEEVGLVHRRIGSGTYLSDDAPQIIERLDADVDVHASHDHSFLETVEARLILEPGVAVLAARNIDTRGLKRLNKALEAITEATNWLEFKSRIYMFSREIYVASGNSLLLATFDQIMKAHRDHKFDGHKEKSVVAEIVRRHSHDQLAKIYEAIERRDEAAAEEVTRGYLIGIAASSGLS